MDSKPSHEIKLDPNPRVPRAIITPKEKDEPNKRENPTTAEKMAP